MLRFLKSIMAEFSYFLEKYFGINSMIWTLMFVSLICSIIIVFIVKVIKLTNKKHFKAISGTIFGISSGVLVFFMNHLMLSAETWNSKLIRVMSNANYVLSFKSNQKPFFDALFLPNNEFNQSNLFEISKYLNHSQWQAVYDNVGEAGWYFEKIEKALAEIFNIGSYHLTLEVKFQGLMAYIPILLIIMIIILICWNNYAVSITLSTLCVFLCPFMTLGTNIFLLLLMVFSFVLYKLSEIKINILDNKKSNNDNGIHSIEDLFELYAKEQEHDMIEKK